MDDPSLKQRPKKAMPVSPGRPKGVPNKTTTLLKDAILQAAETAGGDEGIVGYLVAQARTNPGPFMSLLGKVLPTQIVAEVTHITQEQALKELMGVTGRASPPTVIEG